MDYKKEQLVVILSTVLSLLTAWAWDSLLRDFVSKYYGDDLVIQLVYAVVVTAITVTVINRYLKNIHKEKMKQVQRMDLSNYMIEQFRS